MMEERAHARAPSRRQTRLASALLGVAVALAGCALAAALIGRSVIRGFNRDMTTAALMLGPHVVASKDHGTLREYEEAAARIDRLPLVRKATPLTVAEAKLQVSNGEHFAVLFGMNPRSLSQATGLAEHLTSGSLECLFSDVSEEPQGVLLGGALLSALGKRQGELLTATALGAPPVKLRICGSYATGTAEVDLRTGVVPHRTTQALNGMPTEASQLISIRLRDPSTVEAAIRELARTLGSDFALTSWKELNAKLLASLEANPFLPVDRLPWWLFVTAALVPLAHWNRLRHGQQVTGPILRHGAIIGLSLATMTGFLGMALGASLCSAFAGRRVSVDLNQSVIDHIPVAMDLLEFLLLTSATCITIFVGELMILFRSRGDLQPR